MSRHFFEAFFPATSRILAEKTPGIYETIFPMPVVEQCPEIRIESVSLRNPILFLQACIGVSIGLMMGCYRFSSSCHHHHDPASSWWRTAFVSFGLMNLVAIPLHCFLSESSENRMMVMPYPETHGILWFLDCYCTGVSAMSIMAAILRSSSMSDNQGWFCWSLLSLCHVCGVGCGIVWFLWPSWTLPLEPWYLFPMIASGLIVAYWLIKQQQQLNTTTSRQKHVSKDDDMAAGTFLIILGCCFVVGGLLHQWYSDAFRAGTLVFAGCNLAFGGLFCRIKSVTKQKAL